MLSGDPFWLIEEVKLNEHKIALIQMGGDGFNSNIQNKDMTLITQTAQFLKVELSGSCSNTSESRFLHVILT